MSKILERYIQEILDFKARQKQILQEKELREIGQELGMSDEDWQNLQQNFQDHLHKGKSFAQYKNWEDAIAELEVAESLHPYNTEVLANLAEAYKRRWLAKEGKLDRARAEVLARRLLEVEPTNQTAIRLISSLREHTELKSKKKENKASQQWLFWLLVGLLCLGGLFYHLSNARENRAKDPHYQEQDIPKSQRDTDNSIGQSPMKKNPSTPSTSNPSKNRGDKKEPRYLIDFIETDASKSIHEVKVEESSVADFEGAYSAKFNGYIFPKNVDVTELKMEASLIDDKGKVIEIAYEEVVEYDQDPVQWHSDAIPFHFSFFKKIPAPPTIKEIKYKISSIKTQAIPNRQEWKKSKEVVWPDKPTEWDLQVEVRKNDLSNNAIMESIYHKYTLGVKNTGTAPIRFLKLKVRWIGNQDQELDKGGLYIVGPDEPPLQPGMAFTVDGIKQLKIESMRQVKDFELSIDKIE